MGESESLTLEATDEASSAALPHSTRLTHEIPKPKDWQLFQRLCVVLFREELTDPHVQEYGRSGQKQRGIDLIGRRFGGNGRYVGIQCRNVKEPLKKAKILSDCRAALTLNFELSEIIFATTAPDDTGASDAAAAVEQELRDEGYDLRVALYGWEALQTLIAMHPVAYAAFCPSIVAKSSSQSAEAPLAATDLSAQVATKVVDQLAARGLSLAPNQAESDSPNSEDPALHARIDTFRDLYSTKQQAIQAREGFLELVESEPLVEKPWAKFRIETNLGAIALDLGRETEGARYLEAAYELRPDDPKAIANLALARTVQGQYEEAMELAQRALEADPSADFAVAYLLQAAARSEWQGDPEELIPEDLVGSEHADIGLAEFLRLRELPNWAMRSLDLGARHSDSKPFKQIRALAVLALASDTDGYLFGGAVPLSMDQLSDAADDLKNEAERRLAIDYANNDEFIAVLSNAAVLLRLSDRCPECEALLSQGLAKLPNAASLRPLLAAAQVDCGKTEEALNTLAQCDDAECQLMHAELTAAQNPTGALEQARAIDSNALSANLSRTRWHLIGELASQLGETTVLDEAVAGLRAMNSRDMAALILEIRGERIRGRSEEETQERLRDAAANFPTDSDMRARFVLAQELFDHKLPGEASALLDGYVHLSHKAPATKLYLHSLAAARRDEAFRHALAAASPNLQDDPETLWMVAAHAWNAGDLARSLKAIDRLLEQLSDHSGARLLKLEILIRQDQSADVLAELDKPIENLPFARLDDQCRVVKLLAHFGHIERAATLAYRLFLEHRNSWQSWMTLSSLVLMEGKGEADVARPWDVSAVAPNVAVNICYSDGEKGFLIVEPDDEMRRFDVDSWAPDHPLVQRLMGLEVGAEFESPTGRSGTVEQIRHKIVARFHYALEHLEERFPTFGGFRRVTVDFDRPDGLDEMIAEMKARRDWVEQEAERYVKGPWPIGVLAHRIGIDVIEAAAGLASQGIPLKVARGNQPERDAASDSIQSNDGRGCVLDLCAYWMAWRLQALEVIVSTCGPIQLPQSVLDRLRARREQFAEATSDGLRTAMYQDGRLVVHEASANEAAGWRDDIDGAIKWAEANAEVHPVVVSDDLPTALRDSLSSAHSDMFDSLVLAIQGGLLLVTDDLPTRELNCSVGGNGGTWLHQVLDIALHNNKLELDKYIDWSAQLVEASHSYLGIKAIVLARALGLDMQSGKAPGRLFTTLSRLIGGRSAEPESHVRVCVEFLRIIWSGNNRLLERKASTGLLLRRLIRERHDYISLIEAVMYQCRDRPRLLQYIQNWAVGHFILKDS